MYSDGVWSGSIRISEVLLYINNWVMITTLIVVVWDKPPQNSWSKNLNKLFCNTDKVAWMCIAITKSFKNSKGREPVSHCKIASDGGPVYTWYRIIIMPWCACASEVYISVFVCLRRLLQLLKDQWSASKGFYRLLVTFSWILICGFAK